jgi:MFS family permease
MALGTATAYPSAVVMVGTGRLADTTSTRPLGRIQMANTSAAAVGPVVGGLLVSLVGWQALFLINVPLALARSAGRAPDRARRCRTGAAVRFGT